MFKDTCQVSGVECKHGQVCKLFIWTLCGEHVCSNTPSNATTSSVECTSVETDGSKLPHHEWVSSPASKGDEVGGGGGAKQPISVLEQSFRVGAYQAAELMFEAFITPLSCSLDLP